MFFFFSCEGGGVYDTDFCDRLDDLKNDRVSGKKVVYKL